MLDWAVDFYTRQDELSGCYTGPLGPHDHERALTVTDALAGRKGRMLELGAGGGQSALATAQQGHAVTALELVARSATHARTLISDAAPGSLRVLEGSFYTLDLAETFDVICYWDGFGVGSDAEQRALLKRIAGWLTVGGITLVDINTPWYWAKHAGRQMSTETFTRQYEFDADGCRMLDNWWPTGRPEERVTQSLRCYSPQDLRLLLEESGLVLESVKPGGAIDYEARKFIPQAPLEQAMQFRALLRGQA